MTSVMTNDVSVLQRLVADQERLRQALLTDAPNTVSIEDSVRSYLFRAINAQRSMRLIPDDVFETLLLSAANPEGRNTLLSFFGAPERRSA